MRLEGAFLADIVRIFGGGALDPAQADSLAQRLGSTQEFLASIFLQDAMLEAEGDLLKELNSIAKAEESRPETRRSTSLLEEAQRSQLLHKIAKELNELVSNSASNEQREHYLHECLLSLGEFPAGGPSLRHQLGVHNPDVPETSE